MADEAKAKGNGALKSGLSDAERALPRASSRSRAGPGASPFGDAFGPEMWVRLASDPSTRRFLQQPDFVKMTQDLQKNPNNLNMYLKDQRVMQALGALLNLKFQTRGPEEDSEAQSPTDSGYASDGGPPERKRPEPEYEPMAVAEEKEKEDRMAHAQKEKEAGNAAYKKDFEIAIQHYSKAIDLDDEDISFLTNRAAVYLEMGKFEDCIKDCDKAVERGRELRSDFKMIAMALTRKGTALLKMAKVSKDYDLAIEAFQKALTEHRNPDTLKKLNEAEKAKKDLEQQEYFNPQIADEERDKGNQYFKEQKYPEAVKHYSEAIKRNPKDPKMADTIITSETSSQFKEFNLNYPVICRVEKMGVEREREEKSDERREAAIAAAAPLRPNFKSKSGITEAQLSKFQELHKRRLQIKAKLKVNKGAKVDGKGKSHKKAVEANECTDELNKTAGDSSSAKILENKVGDSSPMEAGNVAHNLVVNKRQKLHWGLDAKERWERKSNM